MDYGTGTSKLFKYHVEGIPAMEKELCRVPERGSCGDVMLRRLKIPLAALVAGIIQFAMAVEGARLGVNPLWAAMAIGAVVIGIGWWAVTT